MKKSFFDTTATFSDRVREVVRGIRKGEVLSYQQVAMLAGSPGASRAVGMVMKNNYDPTVPCHRVVRSDGSVCDYNRGGREVKIALLMKEGVSFIAPGTVALTK